jgi:hypothetical protein
MRTAFRAVVAMAAAATVVFGAAHVVAAETSRRGPLAAFADKVDVACVRSAGRVMELDDPDGVGGEKPLGLGAVMQTWVADMARVVAPPSIAADWRRALRLLRRAGERLDDAERLAAQGRGAESGEAQSEALWSLEARAAKIIAKLRIPFRICFVE